MSTKRQTKQDLEDKIAQLEAKLNSLSIQLETPDEAPKPEEKPTEAPKPEERPAATTKPKGTLPKGFEAKPAETKPAETKPAEPKPAEPKPAEPKPAEPKPAETTAQPPATYAAALEDAYMNAPMTDFHKYRATVTGYTPAPNRYFVRKTSPVGKIPTSNWNEQKTKVPGYTAPSNQYYATKARFANYPGSKFFGGFSGNLMTVEGISEKTQEQKTPATNQNENTGKNSTSSQNIEQPSGTQLTKEIAESLVGKNLEIKVYGDIILGSVASVNLVNDREFLRINTKKGSSGFPLSDIKEWNVVEKTN